MFWFSAQYRTFLGAFYILFKFILRIYHFLYIKNYIAAEYSTMQNCLYSVLKAVFESDFQFSHVSISIV